MSEDRKFTLQVVETLEVVTDKEQSHQQEVTGEIVSYGDREAWFDVATVTMPARSKNTTALRAAAKQAGIEIPEDGLKVRLLPGDVAEPITLLPPAPAPGPRQVRL